MQQIEQGNTIRLIAYFRDENGVLTDPTNPLVDIIDPAETTKVNDGVPTKDSVGTYHYDYAIPSDGLVGIWRAHWTGTISGVGVSDDDYFEVIVAVVNYTTLEELRAAPWSITTGEATDAVINTLLSLTRELIDKLCGQSFKLTTETLTLDGTGHDTIFLPKPIISVIKIEIEGEEIASTYFSIKDKYIIYKGTTYTYEEDYYLFPKGKDNIKITGQFGYSAVPKPINYLQARLIEREIRKAKKLGQFQSESIGDYSYTLSQMAASGDLGDAELNMIIERYRKFSLPKAI